MAIQYGKNFEDAARRKFGEMVGVPVQHSGLFVDIECGFLGASPDGLIGEDGLLEIKCAYSLKQKGYTITDAINKMKLFYLKYNEDGVPVLKTNHNYYYQIQGQLNITKRKFCYFIVYIDEDQPLFVQKIERDANLWENTMLPKLKEFYMGCFLPEKIQKFISRGISCTHKPPSIIINHL